jgi:hypothetical protein
MTGPPPKKGFGGKNKKKPKEKKPKQKKKGALKIGKIGT